MRSLRSRLVIAFLAATVLPFLATVWVTSSLLDRSLSYATTQELDDVSRTLERTVRQFYQRERERLRGDARRQRDPDVAYERGQVASWPESVRAFWESGEADGFELSGDGGHVLHYMRRSDAGVAVYTRELGVRMRELSSKLVRTRT